MHFAMMIAKSPPPEILQKHPELLIVFVFAWLVFVTSVITFAISRLSGWALLASRFRAQQEFCVESWRWQSGRFRLWCAYNNCLVVGANPQELYLAVMWPANMFHEPLLIPWTEITVKTGKYAFGFYDTALLRLGSQEQVSLRIYGRLVGRVRQAAGPGWPNYQAEQMVAQVER